MIRVRIVMQRNGKRKIIDRNMIDVGYLRIPVSLFIVRTKQKKKNEMRADVKAGEFSILIIFQFGDDIGLNY